MVDTPNLDDELIKAILREYKINSADITFKCDASEDDLIDVIEGNRKYIPCLYALNKIDDITLEELEVLDRIPHYVPVSAHLEWNLDDLVDKIWEYLDLIRIYTKPKGQEPDYEEPVILSRTKSQISDFCNRIHRNMLRDLKYAIVWGTSVRFNP